MGEGPTNAPTNAPTISTHVLDTERGTPGAGYAITLNLMTEDGWALVGSGVTDEDGRIRRLLESDLVVGEYRLDVDVSGSFFRHASLTFVVDDTGRSYHVPLLLSPYSLTTYRGS